MKYRNILKKRILAGLLAGAAACAAAPAALAAGSPVQNTQLPQGGNFAAGVGTIGDPVNGQMTITQTTQNGVIKWDGGFNVGANATVNFEGPQNGYNTLNYDASGNMSQIYGAINANNNGNIYIVNAAGVEIGNSAQINVGSLYVSNRNLDDALKNLTDAEKANPNITNILNAGTTTDAALMSLGNINASQVTFDGSRVVIDTERLKTGDEKMVAGNIKVNTTDAGSVVIGYDAYDKENETYAGANDGTAIVTVNDATWTKADGYMWVEDVEQLQKIDTNLGGNYALRNSIDATATQDWNDKKGFKPIGITIDDAGKASVTQNGDKYGFYGKFDGLDYNIFNLNISREGESHVGLFGVVHDAVVNNVTFVGGSIAGGNVVGSLAGAVVGKSHISNITNSASVTGATDVGGIVGYSGNILKNVGEEGSEVDNIETQVEFSDLINTGTVKGEDHTGTPTEHGNNIGGLIGNLYNGSLGGTSYNLGSVTGEGHNVGGLVGHAYASTLGDGTNLIYNRLDVEGAYNVGGIVGSMEGTTVQNAENSGTVTATGYTDGKYSYHTAHYDENTGAVGGVMTVDVDVANVGGIAGSASHVEGHESKLENVLNTGDVSSAVAKENGYDYYTAGNVGGIVGSAVDTDITNATNRENDIRGAHNVGGVAGYFSGKGTITNGVNDGGDILATGARHGENFVKEWVRAGPTGGEEAIIGNMGGIVGYMEGDEAYITASANRGTVHSHDITGTTVPLVSQAANAGGIVGKIDRSKTLTKDELGDKYINAAVSNSYNTGDVRGYMGVGGVAGMMYNGEIAGSYNLGTIQTTRNADSFGTGEYYSVNMGGVVGDTTENSRASALLYDVYNKGQIGDETYQYYARHVGGIVGRLSGTVEKAYNTGAIYNGYNVVGGIAGWFAAGSITNAFNTGNITVNNNEQSSAGIQTGGIAGGAYTGKTSISYVYNLGTIRGFQTNGFPTNGYAVGGIVGAFIGNGSGSITNAYTTGNLYLYNGSSVTTEGLGSIYGTNRRYTQTITTTNTYYIKPDEKLNGSFLDLTDPFYSANNADYAIDFADKDKAGSYTGLTFNNQDGAGIDEDDGWRIYDGTTPILNAFLPNTEGYFSENGLKDSNGQGGFTVQYGTAYDPLLTIIKANTADSLTFNWIDLGANNAAGIAVYGAGLTLNDFMATGGSGYFGGLIYSDGALSLVAHKGEESNKKDQDITGDVALGSAAEIYGSSVDIDATGDVTIYGDVTATGNIRDGASDDEKATKEYTDHSGNITITGGNVDIYGQLTSGAVNESIKGIGSIAEGWTPGNVADPNEAMSDIGDRFAYKTNAGDTVNVAGNITITANDASDGHVNVYYGNQEEGFIDAAGDLTIDAAGDIYMDSDLSIGGNLTLNAGYKEGEDKPAADSEAVLDISNIGKVQAANGMVTDALTGLHAFLDHFAQEGKNITLKGDETKLAVDMWGDGAFGLTKYDLPGEVEATLADKLDRLHINGEIGKGKHYTYIWVSTGEQLAGIQQAADTNPDFLGYNFALKNDIDASGVKDYEAIGAGAENGYTGTFDGRDNRIIGLDTTKKSDGTTQTLTNAGIFGTIGTREDGEGKIHTGTVEDLRVYSGTFTGTDNAGAVAGVNNGTISNVTAFGNVVDVQNTSNGAFYAGGIAGTNSGTIDNVTVTGTATQSSEVTAGSAEAAAGGIAGLNDGTISNSTANSAVNSSAGDATALGGVAGVNEGMLNNVDSLGVTTGVYKVEGKDTLYSDSVGGIAGTNSGTVENAYNESIVSGRDNVGGILGVNTATAAEGEDSPVSNVANASSVTGEAGSGDASDYVGGLVGNNEGSITNGRNNGEITGNNYVGGLVGNNQTGSILKNLVNDEAAAITGDNYVGGIAGANAGEITASSVDEDGQVIEGNDNLINRGTITGQQYVGGVAGVNTGTISNTNNNVELHVKNPVATGDDAPKYFGGVVGWNKRAEDENGDPVYGDDGKTIIGTITDATNHANVSADGATYVGGIVGKNDGVLSGMNGNYGNVSGKDYVGGVAGENSQDLTGVEAVNRGDVTASEGGAGGIFGENNGVISNVHLTNEGNVTGTATDKEGDTSGTGGIFGINHSAITGSILENLTGDVSINTEKGQVAQNVGGLIGINTGDVSTSSLKNEANITVTAGNGQTVKNVGGLIGDNSGNITGGRDENDGYYKYQIYNNGTITVDGNGSNIGGLIGTNHQKKDNEDSGKVIAGYNTGAVIAGGSTNVGGIAGTNSGTLGQVFNTVITKDGQNQTITGSTNVGGLVGSNTGMISNAYNTSTVKGTTSGSLVGTNDGTVSNVYGSGADKLIGSGTGNTSNMYDLAGEGDWDKADSYTGFDFNDTWKIYEGSTNPLLKVFLTKVTISGDTDLDLVYNGKNQDIDLDDFTFHSGIFAADGFAAYENNNSLIQNTDFEHKNAGEYDNWLYSGQIAASNGEDGFNPNNLGYDIDFKQDIDKAVIKVEGNTVDRTYGSSNISDNGSYGFIVSGINTGGELTSEMKQELTGGNLGFDSTQVSDGALSTETGRVTNDVSDNYTWSANLSLGDALKGNYVFEAVEGQDGTTTTVTGQSHVNKAGLIINAESDTIYVGGTPQFSGTANAFVNGDSFQLDFGMSAGNANLPQTAGTYEDVVGFWYNGTFYGTQDVDKMQDLFGRNYNVKFTPGTLTVQDLPEGMPDISDIPSIERHWNFLFDDNPWDRNRDFRERKAEVHFVAGGMTL